jgi:non-heme chloroperoxidase
MRRQGSPSSPQYSHAPEVMVGGTLAAVAVVSGQNVATAQSTLVSRSAAESMSWAKPMDKITTKDGVEIFYKDWGKGQPIVFNHGWPL